MICEIEISTEISVSFLERLHEIEREIISHRAAKTVNSNFIFGTEKSFSVPTLVRPERLCRSPKGTLGRASLRSRELFSPQTKGTSKKLVPFAAYAGASGEARTLNGGVGSPCFIRLDYGRKILNFMKIMAHNTQIYLHSILFGCIFGCMQRLIFKILRHCCG